MFEVQDWLANGLPSASFDRAYAIESTEHMDDKERCFAEAFRTLRPGGQLVVCAWLANRTLRRWHVRYLLKPICQEGRLPGLGDEAEYVDLLRRAGLPCRVWKTTARPSHAPGRSAFAAPCEGSPPTPRTGASFSAQRPRSNICHHVVSDAAGLPQRRDALRRTDRYQGNRLKAGSNPSLS
jgi:hypothetical protein